MSEPSGLEAVFIAQRHALLRFLRARGAGDDAEDLVQDLWLRVSAADTGPVAEPVAFLLRAANNLMIERYRGAVRARRRDAQWLGWREADEAEQARLLDSGRILAGREALARAESVLAGLGSRADFAFRRFRLEGATIGDIAGELGVSRSTVEKDLQKAYRALLKLQVQSVA